VRDIQQGEELCINYIPLLQPRAKRQADLLQKYGFECDCKVCCPNKHREVPMSSEEEQVVFQESDRRRAQLQEISLVPMLEIPKHQLVSTYENALRLMAEEDFHDPLMASQFWQGGFVGHMSAKKKQSASTATQWLENAHKFAEVCWGPYARPTQELAEYKQQLIG